MVRCPICQEHVALSDINGHLDSGCQTFIATHLQSPASSTANETDCEQAVLQQEPNAARKKSDTGSPSTELATERLHLRVAPLAEHVRPRCFDDIVGQEALIGPNGTLRRLIEHSESDLVGSPRKRQNHDCKDHRAYDENKILRD
ncbi:Werner helicase interacting protein 1 [Aspergillus brasiliensis]|uniref:Werner helicase interacting protein 1 n=1 Tax=Aspergillus brasiliensis TaxID=319629 RepID=A0A9W6DST8_9EURO|nr:Werner helicase interacting protein 1 [Aspergillus brasiliensis]